MNLLSRFLEKEAWNHLPNLFGMNTTPNNSSTTTPAPQSIPLYKHDLQDAAKWALVGGIGFASYQLGIKAFQRKIDSCADFKHPVEAIQHDPVMREAFLNLQGYSQLRPYEFQIALSHADRLLFLEQQLITGQVQPTRNDKAIAFTCFRMSAKKLNELKNIVRDKMGNDHGLVVHLLIEKIYKKLQAHLLNVLHLCSKFDPLKLIEKAPKEIEKLLAREELQQLRKRK